MAGNNGVGVVHHQQENAIRHYVREAVQRLVHEGAAEGADQAARRASASGVVGRCRLTSG